MGKPDNRISHKHYTTISEAASRRSSISVYGKLVKNGEVEPTLAGISHPTGASEKLKFAQVVGYLDDGQCIKLQEPKLIALPTPDGPADGCAWEPQEYVVWKNLPKNWATLHLKASTMSLGDALIQPRETRHPVALDLTNSNCLDTPAAITLVRSCGNVGSGIPLSTPLSQLFPSATGRTAFCQCVADGVPIDRSQIPCGGTNSLQDVVDAISC